MLDMNTLQARDTFVGNKDAKALSTEREQTAYLSKYDEQILHIDKVIEPWYFIAAGIFTWLLLAGFLMSPSTYASVQESKALTDTGAVGKSLMTAVRNVPLIYLACFACLIATVGLVILWRKWKSNVVWVNRYLVVPTLMHSAMGLGSSLLNVYSMQDGQWSITAIITVVVIGLWFVLSIALFVLYDRFMVPGLKKQRWMPVTTAV
ncbi:hypothetical protein Purlil1_13077 [Purpureocillium lilacinum]|uniref:Uncharacterized protein n=1 Tax=Purpureocillium lilacinum TaxID=33203 RepID=A0ABR0BF12_PURLI|nr:hypothetical protein Purlil1_13077 [Purpureocillium lilacinum]